MVLTSLNVKFGGEGSSGQQMVTAADDLDDFDGLWILKEGYDEPVKQT